MYKQKEKQPLPKSNWSFFPICIETQEKAALWGKSLQRLSKNTSLALIYAYKFLQMQRRKIELLQSNKEGPDVICTRNLTRPWVSGA